MNVAAMSDEQFSAWWTAQEDARHQARAPYRVTAAGARFLSALADMGYQLYSF